MPEVDSSKLFSFYLLFFIVMFCLGFNANANTRAAVGDSSDSNAAHDNGSTQEQADGSAQEQVDGSTQEQADGSAQDQADGSAQEQADGSSSQEQADDSAQEQADGSAQEQAADSSTQEQADGSSSQEHADGSSSQEQADGSSTQEQADGSAQEQAAGSSSQDQADGSAQEQADGSTQEQADGSAQDQADGSTQEQAAGSAQDQAEGSAPANASVVLPGAPTARAGGEPPREGGPYRPQPGMKPQDLRIHNAGFGNLQLNWRNSTGAGQYYFTVFERYNNGRFKGIGGQFATNLTQYKPLKKTISGTYSYKIEVCTKIETDDQICLNSNVASTQVAIKPSIPGVIKVPPASNNGEAKLTWGAPLGLVTHYQIRRHNDMKLVNVNQGDSINIAFLKPASQAVFNTPNAALHYTFRQVPDGIYRFEVRACYTAAACGPYRKATGLLRAYGVPSVPKNLHVVGGNYQQSSRFTLQWWPSTGQITHYKIKGNDKTDIIAGTSLTRYNQSPGNYSYQVAACNPNGACSAYSPRFSFIVEPAHPMPATPEQLELVQTSLEDRYEYFDDDNQFILRWQAPIQHRPVYHVLEEVDGSGHWREVHKGKKQHYIAKDRQDGVYRYQVYACYVDRQCSDKAYLSKPLRIRRGPNAPNQLSAVMDHSGWQLSLGWQQAAGTSQHFLIEQQKNNGPWLPLQWVSGDYRAHTVTLRHNGVYRFRIKACSAEHSCSGASVFSQAFEVKRCDPAQNTCASTPLPAWVNLGACDEQTGFQAQLCVDGSRCLAGSVRQSLSTCGDDIVPMCL